MLLCVSVPVVEAQKLQVCIYKQIPLHQYMVEDYQYALYIITARKYNGLIANISHGLSVSQPSYKPQKLLVYCLNIFLSILLILCEIGFLIICACLRVNVFFFFYTCICTYIIMRMLLTVHVNGVWKVCEISTNKSSIKVCENVCQKVYEKDVKRITWFHTVFHLSFTCLSHSIISHACEKRCETCVKRCQNHMKTVWNKPAFHTLFHICFTCLLLGSVMFENRADITTYFIFS